MTKPIYILAGQSNAGAVESEVRDYLASLHGADQFALVTVHSPGASLTYKRPDADWNAAGELQAELSAKTILALENNPTGEIAGLIWLQGEGDTHDVANPEHYAKNLSDVIATFRETVESEFPDRATGVTDMPVVVSGLSQHAEPAATRSNWNPIRESLFEYAGLTANAAFVDPDRLAAEADISASDIFWDGLHYAQDMQELMSQHLVDALHSVNEATLGSRFDDFLTGTGAGDELNGGYGNDTYFLNHYADAVFEQEGQGTDRIVSIVNVDLKLISNHVENVILSGLDGIDAKGNRNDNVISGNSLDNAISGRGGRDQLFGGDGNDVINGGKGADLMAGGGGDDIYVAHQKKDRISENSAEGHDLVKATVNFSLNARAENVEDLKLQGRSDLSATGNDLSNTITGNSGDNHMSGRNGDDLIFGRAGDDVLVGGRGDDQLSGGRGADTFVFNNQHGHDRVLDFDVGTDKLVVSDEVVEDGFDVTQVEHGVLLTFSESSSIMLFNVDTDGLHILDLF